MQPTDPCRPAVDLVADLLERTGKGPARSTDEAAHGLYSLVAGRLRATETGAEALGGLEREPGRETARAAAAAALAAAAFADPSLPAQLGQWVGFLRSQWPDAPGLTAPRPPTAGGRPRTGLIVGIVAAALLLCGAGAVGGVVLVNRLLDEPPDTRPWHEQAADIGGVVDYRESRSDLLSPDHLAGTIDYEISPPFGGPHHEVWQNCQGTVYDEPIADEHAVHSLEHGAVWVTYDPSLPADEVERLAGRVRGNNYVFMSPYPGLDSPVVLQAWGYQLRVGHVEDQRIDEFIRILRINAGPEVGATCGGGVTATGDTPVG